METSHVEIAIHAFDGITLFHLATPLLVFGEVTRLGLAENWETGVFTETGAPVRSAEGYVVSETAGPGFARDADLVVFPSWLSGLPEPSEDMLTLLRSSPACGARIAGLRLGAYPVARSGVLEGRTAVTHWESAQAMACSHPAVRFDDSALSGAAAAADVARHIVVAPHREGDQAQYIARPLQDSKMAGLLGKTLEWALANRDQSLEVEDLAGHANMSKRPGCC